MSVITIRRGDWRPAVRPLPNGEAVAAIGDVHGQDDLFAALLGALAEELAGAGTATLVQLGDLVDRGPGAIAAMRRAKKGLPGVRTVALMGNHEDRMLRVLLGGDADEFARWRHWGGDDTLVEAGVDPEAPNAQQRLRAALGAELIDWAVQAPRMVRVGDLVFAHAGIDPEKALGEQDDHTLMWTRWPWLDSAGPYAENVAVIHGHTPQPTVDLGHPHRINLDTGAYASGLLSGLVVAGDRMRIVQAAR